MTELSEEERTDSDRSQDADDLWDAIGAGLRAKRFTRSQLLDFIEVVRPIVSAELQRRNQALIAEVRSLRAENLALKAMREAAETVVQRILAERDSVRSDNEALRQASAKSSPSLAEDERVSGPEVATMFADLGFFAEIAADGTPDGERLASRMLEAQDMLESLVRDRANPTADLASVRSDLTKLRDENERLRDENEALEVADAEVKAALRSEVQRLRDRLHETRADLTQLREAVTALKELSDKATPGPWEVLVYCGDRPCVGEHEAGCFYVMSPVNGPVAQVDTDPGQIAYVERGPTENGGPEDAALIVGAVNLVRALLPAPSHNDVGREASTAYQHPSPLIGPAPTTENEAGR